MKIYSIYTPPKSKAPLEETQIIPEGFSIFAMIFPTFWAIYHRFWPMALLTATVEVTVWNLLQQHGFGHAASLLAAKSCWDIYLGLSANDWRQYWLEKRGWHLADVVTGNGRVEAERRFLDRWFAEGHPYHPSQGQLI